MALGSPTPLPVPEQLEDVACNLCGGRDTGALLRKDGFDIVRCRGCGLAYVNPRLPAAAVAAQYNAGYFEGAAFQAYVSERRGYEKTFRYRLARVETLLGGRGRILEVGCSDGFFLTVAQSRGWDPYGIDVAQDAVKYAAETLGLKARAVTLTDAGFPDDFFDAVIMNDTFEHLTDPLGALKQIYRILRPGGVVMLVTRDSQGPAVRLLGARWAYWKPREHLYYYTRPVLRAMLTAAGFGGAFVKSEAPYRTAGFVAGRVGTLASRVTNALHLGQVLLPVWTGFEVAACGNKPRRPGSPMQPSSARQSAREASSEHF